MRSPGTMDRASSFGRRAFVVGLITLVGAACGDGDRDDGGVATTDSRAVIPDPVTTSVAATAPSTARPASSISTITLPTTVVPTTRPATTTTVSTTTIPAPGLPSWTPATLLDGSDSDSPFGSPGISPRFAASNAGAVALQPTGLDAADALTHLWFSLDALSWEPTGTITGERWRSVVAGGPGFVAVGAAETDLPGLVTPIGVLPRPVPVVWTSTDGRQWAPGTIDSAPFEFGEIDDVAVGGPGLIAVGEVWDADRLRGPAVWTSPDGLTWTVLPGDPLGIDREPSAMTVAAGDGGAVAIGLSTPVDAAGPGPTRAWWSADGLGWERVADIDSFDDGSSPAEVVSFGSGFVMVGSRGARVALAWSSPDGRTWTDPLVLPVREVTDSTIVLGMGTDGSVLIAFGDDVVFGEGTEPATGEISVWMSLDGTVWEQVPPESLRNDAMANGAGPLGLVRTQDGWTLLGRAVDPATDATVGVAWFGRTVE